MRTEAREQERMSTSEKRVDYITVQASLTHTCSSLTRTPGRERAAAIAPFEQCRTGATDRTTKCDSVQKLARNISRANRRLSGSSPNFPVICVALAVHMYRLIQTSGIEKEPMGSFSVYVRQV
jgi:hypothetical protein